MRTGPALVAAVVLLALAGCTPSGPHVPTSPSARATPVFASDADALKAAESAYAAYLKVSDAIAQDGGADPERIEPLVTKNRLKAELDSASRLSKSGIHTAGATQFDSAQLEQIVGGPNPEISFYACWDATNVRIINSADEDVTPTTRQDRQRLEIVMTAVGGRLPLVLKSDEQWSQSSC